MKTIIITESQLNYIKSSIEDEITYYKFFNKVKKFICDLLNDPINANVDDIFANMGINKQKMVDKLINRNVIIRKEKIKELSDGDGNMVSKMIISYDVPKKNFRRKMKRLYSDIFENKNVINEDEGCACNGATGGVASGATSTINNAIYDTPFGKVQRRKINTNNDTTK